MAEEARWGGTIMDNKDYWRENREYENKRALRWATCPVCSQKQFYIPTKECLMCGYTEVKKQDGEAQ